MYFCLKEADEDTPVYIVEIRNTKLQRWLAQAHIEIGDPVWKTRPCDEVRPMLLAGNTGVIVFSDRDAVGTLVRLQSDQICNLPLAPSKSSVRLVDRIHGEAGDAFWKAARIKSKQLLKVVRHLNSFTFVIQQGGEGAESDCFEIDDETAYHVWGHVGKQRLQLGAARVGQLFYPDRKTINDRGIEIPKEIAALPDTALVIRRITPTSNLNEVNSQPVLIRSADDHKVLLPNDLARHIIVRLCDICWSCGMCEEKKAAC